MGLGDLFAANQLRPLQVFGVGVTANSVTYFAPNGDETPITEFHFDRSPAREFVTNLVGDDDSELAEIDIPVSIDVHPKGWFVIDGQTWKFRGRGGRDLNIQTIQLVLPKETSRRQARGTI